MHLVQRCLRFLMTQCILNDLDVLELLGILALVLLSTTHLFNEHLECCVQVTFAYNHLLETSLNSEQIDDFFFALMVEVYA